MAQSRDAVQGVRSCSPLATETSELTARREGSFLVEYRMKRQKMLDEMS